MGTAMVLAAGFACAKGDVVLAIDADLQGDPSEMQRLLAKIELDYDFVFGQGNVNEITWQSPKLLGQRFHRVVGNQAWTSRVIVDALAIGITFQRRIP